ncbi:hypothetical protein ABEV00_27695 [Paenibacillus thiaminolyticus]|uniref:hypothetical protein n=1 Tax=Paenibacillus thiaminolyticus TaxID=49283 RepID=UPI003D2E530D
MNSINLIDIIRGIPVTNHDGYGLIISRADIYEAFRKFSSSPSEVLNVYLKDLEKQGLIEIVYMNQAGFEDFIIGVRLK